MSEVWRCKESRCEKGSGEDVKKREKGKEYRRRREREESRKERSDCRNGLAAWRNFGVFSPGGWKKKRGGVLEIFWGCRIFF